VDPSAKKIEVQIVGDASSLQRALSDATGHTSKFGSALGTLAKTGALAAGAAGIGAVAVTLRQGIKEYTEAAKVAAQTNAVIKSTGGIANVTAGQVDKLAESMMRKSGVDDEAIKTGENMILTFKNIRNEAGAGNDIFDQTTQAVLDMDTAMSQGNVTAESMAKTSIRVGKALNDPVRGMSALARVGVTFTDAQKEAVKAMVESGDVMGAQKLILKELTSEFGGSAEAIGNTLPKQLNVLKESFNNFAGDLIAKAVPSVQRFVDFLNTRLIPAEGFTAKLKVAWTGIEEVGADLKAKMTAMFIGQDVFSPQEKTMIHIDPEIQIDWGALRQQFKDGFMSALADDSASQELGDKLMAGLENVATRLGDWAKAQPGRIAGDFRAALNMADLSADFQKWILQPLLSLTPLARAAMDHLTFGLIDGVRGRGGEFVTTVTTFISNGIQAIRNRWGDAASAATTLGGRIVSGVTGALAGIGGKVMDKLGDIIRSIATTASNAFAAAVGIGSSIISGVVAGLRGLLGSVASAIVGGVLGGIKAAGGRLHGSGDFEITRYLVGEPLARGIVEGATGFIRANLAANLSDVMRKAMDNAAVHLSAADGGTSIGGSLKGGIDDFLEDKLPDNLAQVLGLAFDAATANFSAAGLGVTWSPSPASIGPVGGYSGGPLISPSSSSPAPIVVNISAPIGSQKQLEDMVVGAMANVRNRGGIS
jgi:hypothetical protein